MLIIENLIGGYNASDTLRRVSLRVEEGQVVSLLGSNGAGKTSTLKAISGMLPRASGRIEFLGQDLMSLPADKRSALGLAHVPEGRRVFPTLSVEDNLLMGAWSRSKSDREGSEADRADIYAMFPRLEQRRKQQAGTMSGGEQQMLAIGRALMARPRLLVLDEPSMGLSPSLVAEVFATIGSLKEKGMTILIVEQFAKRALALSDYAYVLQRGEVVLADRAEPLLADDAVHKAYLS